MELMQGLDAILQLNYATEDFNIHLKNLNNSLANRTHKLQEYALKENANKNYIEIMEKELNKDLMALKFIERYFRLFKRAYDELDKEKASAYGDGFQKALKYKEQKRFSGTNQSIRNQSIAYNEAFINRYNDPKTWEQYKNL